MYKKFKKIIKNENGQAVTELALVLPLLIMLIVGGLLLGIVIYNQIVVVTSANQGARLGAALSANEDISPHAAATSARSTTESTLSRATTSCQPVHAARQGQSFRVEVTCHYNLPIPFMPSRLVELNHEASYHIFE
ncbi:TadE family protein [Halalkalibacter krulwichiae]|uniref:TadE-like protein n=1 Tax=Halalkalibacter krulwichiae TaxID=199441 RepID=A0A1X9MLX1_9BACI|nr:TadE/TadG family type IV pilus assembly protein [Halalkalibacter krulwichiae]ARK31992.1 TadE-like protein [Halalkalibacter krulwichiae]